jgi:hypothetical protein
VSFSYELSHDVSEIGSFSVFTCPMGGQDPISLGLAIEMVSTLSQCHLKVIGHMKTEIEPVSKTSWF